MGSFHSRSTVFENIDMFGYLGLFSGGADYKNDGSFGGLVFDCSKTFNDKETFNSQLKLLFVSGGDREIPLFHDDARRDILALKQKGYNAMFNSYPGYHEWDVWRKSVYDMVQLLF